MASVSKLWTVMGCWPVCLSTASVSARACSSSRLAHGGGGVEDDGDVGGGLVGAWCDDRSVLGSAGRAGVGPVAAAGLPFDAASQFVGEDAPPVGGRGGCVFGPSGESSGGGPPAVLEFVVADGLGGGAAQVLSSGCAEAPLGVRPVGAAGGRVAAGDRGQFDGLGVLHQEAVVSLGDLRGRQAEVLGKEDLFGQCEAVGAQVVVDFAVRGEVPDRVLFVGHTGSAASFAGCPRRAWFSSCASEPATSSTVRDAATAGLTNTRHPSSMANVSVWSVNTSGHENSAAE